MRWHGLDRSDSGKGPMEGSCEHDNEPPGSIKCWEVLEWLHNWQRLKKGSAIWVSEWQWGVESKRGPLGTSAIEWPIVPAPGDYDDGEFGGLKIGRGNRSTWRKPAPSLLCTPQIPLDQTCVRTPAAAVGSQRLTAWAMARPDLPLKMYPCNRSWRPIGLWDVEAPTFSLDNRLTDCDKVVYLTRRPIDTPLYT
jgi:hypothetical protein